MAKPKGQILNPAICDRGGLAVLHYYVMVHPKKGRQLLHCDSYTTIVKRL